MSEELCQRDKTAEVISSGDFTSDKQYTIKPRHKQIQAADAYAKKKLHFCSGETLKTE